jgi:hypothetical protein
MRKLQMNKDSNYQFYKAFIDDFVGLSHSVSSRWVAENRGWPDFPENEEINRFLGRLTAKDKRILVRLLQDEAKSAVHNVLAYFNDHISSGMIVSLQGDTLPVEPLGYQMYYDWLLRMEGKSWPEVEMMTIGEQITES